MAHPISKTANFSLIAALFVVGLTPSGVLAQSDGVIAGQVQLQDPPRARRSANRYPSGQSQTRAIQAVPAIAYLVGQVGGMAPDADPSMVQRDTTFSPSVVFVSPGGSVSFPNDDPFQHNVYSYSGAMTFDLGRQNPETSETRPFPNPGIVEVFCEVHDFMRGVIVVTESPYHDVVASDGSFRIEGVPAGEYTIAFWSPEHEPLQQRVAVRSGETTAVEVELER